MVKAKLTLRQAYIHKGIVLCLCKPPRQQSTKYCQLGPVILDKFSDLLRRWNRSRWGRAGDLWFSSYFTFYLTWDTQGLQ